MTIADEPPRGALDCLLIADDLTGACDAAVNFSLRGYRTLASVSMRLPREAASVVAVNAATRNLDPQQAEQRIREAATMLPIQSSQILFKKVDSTLRGHAGREVAAAMIAFACDAVIFTPAFPALGRIVEKGWLHVDGEPSVEIAAWLQGQRVMGWVHTRPGGVTQAIAKGARLISLDATGDSDLDAVVAEGRSLEKRILWAGSGGLASALARAMPPGRARIAPDKPPCGPVLFCIGSDHPATVAQQARLLAARSVYTVTVNMTAEEIATLLRFGDHVLLPVPCTGVAAGTLPQWDMRTAPAALLLSGGDTASAICEASGAHFIELYDEIAAGVPRGLLRGGALDGIAVVTKSGGFGGPDTLIAVADFFWPPERWCLHSML